MTPISMASEIPGSMGINTAVDLAEERDQLLTFAPLEGAAARRSSRGASPFSPDASTRLRTLSCCSEPCPARVLRRTSCGPVAGMPSSTTMLSALIGFLGCCPMYKPQEADSYSCQLSGGSAPFCTSSRQTSILHNIRTNYLSIQHICMQLGFGCFQGPREALTYNRSHAGLKPEGAITACS